MKWDELFEISWKEIFDTIKAIPVTDDYEIKFRSINEEKVKERKHTGLLTASVAPLVGSIDQQRVSVYTLTRPESVLLGDGAGKLTRERMEASGGWLVIGWKLPPEVVRTANAK